MGTTSSKVRSIVLPAGLFRTRAGGRARSVTTVVRVAAAAIVLVFGVIKFVVPEFERAEFVRFGLPDSIAIVYLVGLLEVVGGLMLMGRRTAAGARPARRPTDGRRVRRADPGRLLRPSPAATWRT